MSRPPPDSSPHPDATSMPNPESALRSALGGLLASVAELSVARGLPFSAVEEALKKAFVQAAAKAHPDVAEHRRVSRVSTTTGINRREVTRLTQVLADQQRDGPPTHTGRAGRSLASEVFTHWRTHADYLDPHQQPRVLPRLGDAPSFEALAHRVTRDVHSRALLDELCRLGLAVWDQASDSVQLKAEPFVPHGDEARLLGFLADNVGDHLRAAVANVLGDGKTHFEQAVYADGLTTEDIGSLRPAIAAQWRSLMGALVPSLEEQVKRAEDLPPERKGRVRVGLYSYFEGGAPALDAIPAARSGALTLPRRAVARKPKAMATVKPVRGTKKTTDWLLHWPLHPSTVTNMTLFKTLPTEQMRRLRRPTISNCNPRRLWALRWPKLSGTGAFVLAALLWGCGGGVGSGGTGGFASGPITGFGSIIVNDVVFDDTGADIKDSDGNRLGRDALRLGMTVEVESGAIGANTNGLAAAAATRIHVQSSLRGPVTTLDQGNARFTVLGQLVQISSSTIFGDGLPHGLSSLAQPAVAAGVEVYGVFDKSLGRYRAFRVDTSGPGADLRLRGPVEEINTASQTVRIGSATYSLTTQAQPPTGLVPGQEATLQLKAHQAGQPFEVTQWGSVVQPAADRDLVKLKGLIGTYSSLANFSVSGRAIDASAAGLELNGAVLAVGVQIEVEGPVRQGVLRATRLKVTTEREDFEKGYEVKGDITEVMPTAIATQPQFVVRGQLFTTSRSDLRYDNGSAALLTVGRRVEVVGQLASDRRTVQATRIKFP